MKRISLQLRNLFLAAVFAATGFAQGLPDKHGSEWTAVEQALGRAGKLQSGGVMKFSMPRSDLMVTIDDVRLKPSLALGSWAAFRKMGSDAIVMGDLVLVEGEVGAVMSALQQGGIEQTALHHHLLNESPRVMYMHIHAHGDPVKIAHTLRSALALTKTPPPSQPRQEERFNLDQKKIEQLLGRQGQVNGGVLQFGIPRAENIRDNGMEVPASMGLAIAINFQPTGNGRAAITGDFVLTAAEVNPVIRTLRENGIAVTALHNHMLTEEPRLFFMHFWANDDALQLARGLRAALEQTNSQK